MSGTAQSPRSSIPRLPVPRTTLAHPDSPQYVPQLDPQRPTSEQRQSYSPVLSSPKCCYVSHGGVVGPCVCMCSCIAIQACTCMCCCRCMINHPWTLPLQATCLWCTCASMGASMTHNLTAPANTQLQMHTHARGPRHANISRNVLAHALTYAAAAGSYICRLRPCFRGALLGQASTGQLSTAYCAKFALAMPEGLMTDDMLRY